MGTEFSCVWPEAEQYGAASAGHFAFPLFISTVERGCFCSLDPDVFTCTCLGWGCPIFLYMPRLGKCEPPTAGLCQQTRLSQLCLASKQLCFCRKYLKIFGCMGMSQIFHSLWERVGFMHQQFNFWNENIIFFFAPASPTPGPSPFPEAGEKLHWVGKSPTHQRFLSQKSSWQMAAGVAKVFGESWSSRGAP